MSVIQGFEAFASEFNTLQTKINKWFADNYPSISFGDSNQIFGWGGDDSTAVVSGSIMLASDMNSLIDQCNIGQIVVNNVSGVLPQIVADVDDILASQYNNIESKSDLINIYKLDIEPSELSLSSQISSIRATSYSTAINCTFKHAFSNFNKSRYFWNSGGAIQILGTITGYSTGTGYDGAGINEILTTMGTVTMNYTETIQSGTGGTPTNIGFYDLTTSYQTIFTQTGTGVYSDAILLIESRIDAIGSYVETRVTITPESGKTVDGTTTIFNQFRKLDNQSSGTKTLVITAPTPSKVDDL